MGIQNVKNSFLDFDICHRTLRLPKLQFMTLTYFFRSTIDFFTSLKRSELAQKFVGDICGFGHLLLNDVITQIVLLDRYLLLES